VTAPNGGLPVSVSSLPAVTLAGTPNVNATIVPAQTVASTSTFGRQSKVAVVTVNAYEARQPFYHELFGSVPANSSSFPSIPHSLSPARDNGWLSITSRSRGG
jgi:hypothetical protein